VKKEQLSLAIAVLLVLWYALSLWVKKPILPPPHKVLLVFLKEITGGMGRHLLWSSFRVFLSLTLGILTAAPLGVVLGQSRRLNQLLSPFIYLLYPIPKVVFVPLAILFFGLGELPKVLIIYLIIFFQILVLVRDQAQSLRPELILSVRSLGAGRRALFRFVYLPATLPAVFTAIRQSTGTAIAVLYLAELFGTRYGLGYYIYLSGSTLLDYPAMYAGIITMSLLGIGLYVGIDRLERKLCPWIVVEVTR